MPHLHNDVIGPRRRETRGETTWAVGCVVGRVFGAENGGAAQARVGLARRARLAPMHAGDSDPEAHEADQAVSSWDSLRGGQALSGSCEREGGRP